jgi:molecular chaperone IbpA
MRTAFDFSPLYRSMIGVDRMAAMIDSALRSDSDGNYPPCDIEKTGENSYRISLAVAGFRPEDLELTAQPNLLVVTGHKGQAEQDHIYLHRGIASRAFERRFELADYVAVKSADYADGILSVELTREVPEALNRAVSTSSRPLRPRWSSCRTGNRRARPLESQPGCISAGPLAPGPPLPTRGWRGWVTLDPWTGGIAQPEYDAQGVET